jgi:thiosulfate reductase cytochrome b subunit
MNRIYLHALPVRVWHWINALSFFALIATGVQIRYRDAVHLTSFKTAVDAHNIAGFVLIMNFILWALYYALSGKLKIYLPDPNLKNFLLGSIRQARYYAYGIFVGEPNPHHATPDSKFNPMQQVAYFNIMLLLMPMQIMTGLMLWDLKLFSGWISFAGGLKVVDAVHLLLSIFFSAFLFVHVYLATLGHTPLTHIKAMFTGYEDEPGHAH